MILDQNRIWDGYDSGAGGVDAGRKPNLIDKGPLEQFEEAENVAFRGGAPTNRPAYNQLGLTFENPNMAYSADGTFQSDDSGIPQSSNVFYLGVFQGVSYYAPREGQEYLMATIGGRLYQITPSYDTASIREIKLLRRNRSTILIAYHVQADVYHIVQDDESSAIIFDGVVARRAVAGEIPVGSIMGYGMNRIVLVGPQGEIEFGNIRDGKGNGGADVLGWDETTFLNEGFPSALPSSMGQPTGIAFLPQQDAATGVGECLVFGERGGAGFNLSIPRETWKDSQFQREVLLGVGNIGHRNLAIVNNDIWFRASDGRRSYRQARAEVDKWGQIPLSTNVKQYVDNETSWLLKFGSAIEFDNRLLTTATPQPNVTNDVYAIQRLYHNGLLSLDFDVISSFGTATRPAWDGRWKEWNGGSQQVLQIVSGKFKGRERAFAFCIDGDPQVGGVNAIFEITKAGTRDSKGPIHSSLTMRSMDFNSEFNEKEIYGGDLWVHDVAGPDTVAVTATYRPDQVPSFLPWHFFTVSPNGGVGVPVGGIPTTNEGYDPRHSLPKPDDTADPVTNRIWRRAFEFQAKLEWVGKAVMRKFRMGAQQLIEDSKAKIP